MALKRALIVLATAGASASIIASAGAASQRALVTVVSDPFRNVRSQHRTAVEPDSFAWGSTVVTAAQVGRFIDGGASDIGWGTSTNGGRTWKRGVLPRITKIRSGNYARVSDPSVAYDARHKAWLIASLPIGRRGGHIVTPHVLVSRSRHGTRWGRPIVAASGSLGMDKDWIVCDDWPDSPYYGHCYIAWDDAAHHDELRMNTSADGGKTWGPAVSTPDLARGLGGQPLVRPNGELVVPFLNDPGSAILWTSSGDGGASFSPSQVAVSVQAVRQAGALRSLQLPSAEMDGAGEIYMTWQDCSFRPACSTNDLVLSKLGPADTAWTPPARIPIGSVSTGADHFIPGIAVDRSTEGTSAHVGVSYYFYPSAACSFLGCRLRAGFISSTNGGATWKAPRVLTSSMRLRWLPLAGGPMVGDYISTSFVGGRAFPFISVARRPSSGRKLRQTIKTVAGGLAP